MREGVFRNLFCLAFLAAPWLGVAACAEDPAQLDVCRVGQVDLNRDGVVDQWDCDLHAQGVAMAAACAVDDGAWRTSDECAAEVSMVVPQGSSRIYGGGAVLPGLRPQSVAISTMEGLLLASPTGRPGEWDVQSLPGVFRQAALRASPGALVSPQHIWLDRDGDGRLASTEIIDVSRLCPTSFFNKVDLLRGPGGAVQGIVAGTQGKICAWKDLDGDGDLGGAELLEFGARELIGIRGSDVIYHDGLGTSAWRTTTWSHDAASVVSLGASAFPSDCETIIDEFNSLLVCSVDSIRVFVERLGLRWYPPLALSYRTRLRQGVLEAIVGQGDEDYWIDDNMDFAIQDAERYRVAGRDRDFVFDAALDDSETMLTVASRRYRDGVDSLVLVERTKASAFLGQDCSMTARCPMGNICEQPDGAERPVCLPD